MKNTKCIIFLVILLSAEIPAIPSDHKWGIGASLTPWLENQELTISRSLTKSWTVLIWGEYSLDKNKIPGNRVFNFDHGYKWLIGPEFRKQIYNLDETKIAPYAGILFNGGYQEYNMTAKGSSEYKKNHNALEGGIELTFGVEYFVKDYISVNIHARFLKYHYTWIDLDTYYPDHEKYRTGYHVFKAFNDYPGLYIRFYF